jgi:hypothetical protein
MAGPGAFPFSNQPHISLLPLKKHISLLLHKIKLHEQINIETKKNSKQFSEKDKTITRSYRPLPRHTLEETPSLHHCQIQRNTIADEDL